MKQQLVCAALSVKQSLIHGYGVFAQQDIQPDSIIEECRALVRREIDKDFRDYYFGVDQYEILLLGNGSLYNHSNQPNACYRFDPDHSLMVFRASRFIARGEEIFISYGKTWFSDRRSKVKEISWWRKLKRFTAPLQMMLRFLLVLGAMTSIVLFARM